jgi:hypothetical protein
MCSPGADAAEKMSSMQSVAEVVATELAKWGVSGVDAAVFGRSDPEGIADTVITFAREHLGATPVAGLFYRASAGCVVGVRLGSGEDVVLKAYQDRWRAPFLRAVQTVQAQAAGGGLPCARARLAPTQLPGRRNLAVVETWWPDPGMRAIKGAPARRVSAVGLAGLIRVCSSLPDGVRAAMADHPLRAVARRLYPEPHSPLFEFETTTDGAAWIDDIARQAASLREADGTPPVVAHTDWSARNIRLGDDRLLAVYDWDSVSLVPESAAVGQAAVTWCVTSEPGGSEFPTLDEIVGFVEDYEAASAGRLSPAQWRAAGGAAAWVLAYTARCEHSLSVVGRARPDQHGARDRLADAGRDLLELTRP